MTPTLRILLVDDEPAAIRRLARLCAEIATIEVVGTAGTADAAMEAIERSKPDLIFLDIQMPGMSGLELAKQLTAIEPQPSIVFVTAHERFALAAFEVSAAGYLLKPVDPDALRKSVTRISSLRSHLIAQSSLRFWVSRGGQLVPVNESQIAHISAERDYARLHVEGESFLIAETLNDLSEKLKPFGFVRIHRSHIVRSDAIAALRRVDRGAWEVVLKQGRPSLPIGRSYLSALRANLGLKAD